MFEYFRKRGLPDFTEDNWKSSLRRWAPGLNTCTDGESDFVYDDAKGMLAEILGLDGPLNGRQCFIEMKSSPEAENNTFYMSSAQYALVIAHDVAL
jgi:hypothetical protein